MSVMNSHEVCRHAALVEQCFFFPFGVRYENPVYEMFNDQEATGISEED